MSQQQQFFGGLSLATIAERTHAHGIQVPVKGMFVRGYDFDPRSLKEKEREFIFSALFPVGLDAFTQNASPEMEDDIRNHLFQADHLLVMRSDGTFSFGKCEAGSPRPIAFRMWREYEVEGIGLSLYLAGMCVLPSWQGKGIGQQMTKYALGMKDYKAVFTVTQNPVAKECMDRAISRESYPQRDDRGHLWHAFARALGVAEEENDGVLVGHYGSSLYGILPQSRTPKYNDLFSRLNRDNGDAYLCYAVL